MKSWSCWNSDGDNFLVHAILPLVYHHFLGIIIIDGTATVSDKLKFVVVDGEMGRILIRCNFIWLLSMIKSFHVWNKLAEPHWVGTFINERAFGGRGFISPVFSLVSYLQQASFQWLWLAQSRVSLSLNSPLQCCQHANTNRPASRPTRWSDGSDFRIKLLRLGLGSLK